MRFDVKSFGDLPKPRPGLGSRSSPCEACTVRHLAICAPMEGRELEEISALTTGIELSPGEPLFDESETARHVFNVTAGTIKIYKLLPDGRRQITGFLFAGDFLGLASQDSYAYSAEAVTPAALCRFERKALEDALTKHPKMERRMLSMASHELAAAQEQMLLLGRKTAKEKIASFLISLSKRAVLRGQPANPVAVAMSRNDIGDFLGLTTETVSRTITQLKKAGVITLLAGGKVRINAIDLLEELTEAS